MITKTRLEKLPLTKAVKAVQIQNIECMVLLMKAGANVELRQARKYSNITCAEFDMNGIVEAIAKRLSSGCC